MLRSGLSPLEVPASCPLSPALTDIATPRVASNVVPLRHPQTRFDSLVIFGLQTTLDSSINYVSLTGLAVCLKNAGRVRCLDIRRGVLWDG